ncbi:CD302 antigen [Chanos chanos]|uniref:CD302 antigen n=1 Tax=Chanos chanos TaxID=29144 RepID=A0A6J2WG07_CHACN|nr:CD302 antigen-like [Chanos chanos]
MESSRRYHFVSVYGIVLFIVSWLVIQGDGCPADGRVWVPSGQSCYHFVHGDEDILKLYSREEAKEMCREYGLLTVSSAKENDFVVQYGHKVWKKEIDVWLGMYYSGDKDTFLWDDNSPLDFENWRSTGPDDTGLALADECVSLSSTTGKWEIVSCSDDSLSGVVCKTAQEPEGAGKNKGHPLLSALVILSVIVILAVSSGIWFLHLRSKGGTSILPSFEYHPPFRSPGADQTCLVEAQETDEVP